jgi:hypothetical protein
VSRAKSGIFVFAPIGGEVGERILALQRRVDPRLGALNQRPHVTLVGSSGMGPIAPDTTTGCDSHRPRTLSTTTAASTAAVQTTRPGSALTPEELNARAEAVRKVAARIAKPGRNVRQY